MSVSITVVTPVWNTPELAPAYWRAMTALSEDDRVVIIDNASVPPAYTEDSVIVNRENLGFSKPCNQGLAWAAMEAETDAVLFLNSDVVMTSTTWIEQIRDALKPKRFVGAVMRAGDHASVDGRSWPYLDGWCLAGMTSDLLDLGGWDEGFEEPSYSGDCDICFRARQAGIKLVAVSVGLRHLENHTSRRLDVTGLSQRNYERYAAKVREALRVAA